MKKPAASARKRAELIMKVRCGLMSASQAAAELGVSRKTYYKWERKGLSGMLESVCDRPAGRHRASPDRRAPWRIALEALERMGLTEGLLYAEYFDRQRRFRDEEIDLEVTREVCAERLARLRALAAQYPPKN